MLLTGSPLSVWGFMFEAENLDCIYIYYQLEVMVEEGFQRDIGGNCGKRAKIVTFSLARGNKML